MNPLPGTYELWVSSTLEDETAAAEEARQRLHKEGWRNISVEETQPLAEKGFRFRMRGAVLEGMKITGRRID